MITDEQVARAAHHSYHHLRGWYLKYQLRRCWYNYRLTGHVSATMEMLRAMDRVAAHYGVPVPQALELAGIKKRSV